MTNAERQKRYRDTQRGGPSEGRWPAGHLSMPTRAKMGQVSRTMIAMCSWIFRHAPDLVPGIKAGLLKVTPTYKRLKGEYDAGVVQAIGTGGDVDGGRLVSSRRDGRFVFQWVK